MTTDSPKPPIKIEYLPRSKLVVYERNPRTHTPEQIDQIAASITTFGFTNPILIDERHQVIAGHGRLAAASQLELERVPCIRLTGLSDVQKRALVIVDNKLALNAGWDRALLADEMQQLFDLDFDLSHLGFDEHELSTLLTPLEAPAGFAQFDEGLETHYRCPKCHYEWSGKTHA